MRRRTHAGERRFVGRGADLERIERLVDEGAAIVTITGAAGIGKTTLAARFAAGLAARARGERAVGFCDLSDTRDAAGIRAAVARALGLPDAEGADEVETAARVGAGLAAAGPLVLVLDNFEQVVRHADATVAAWLAEIPELQMVVTSRERLRLPGEIVHELAPLSLPGGDDPAGGEAVELWIARVRELHPGYQLTPAEAPVVARLVGELDGLPLAIELAAARFGAVTPAELLQRIERRLDVLGRPGGGRRSTLREAIDWSFRLLEPRERAAFAQCAVFSGRITLDAAEAVLDLGGDDALEALQALRDKSLLVYARRGDASLEPALTMFASVRRYAEDELERLPGGAAARERHARYFVDHAERCAALARTDPAEASRRLDAERENLAAVFRRGLGSREPRGVELALRLLVAIEEPRWHDDSPSAHLSWLDEALAEPAGREVAPRVRAQALIARGRVAWRVGRIDTAEQDLDEAVAVAVRAGDASLESLARRFLALVLLLRGRLADSRGAAEQALALALAAGDRRLEGMALGMLGFAARLSGDQRRARHMIERALDRFREVGDAPSELNMRLELIHVHLDAAEIDGARAYAEQALAQARALGLPPQPRLLFGLGHAALEAGDPAEALLRYREAGDAARGVGDLAREISAAACGAVALFEQRRFAAARIELRDARSSAERFGRHLYTGLVTALAGVFEAALGRLDDARELLAAAERDLEGEGRSPHLAALDLCRGFLDLAEARRARADGDAAAAAGLEERARGRLGAALSGAGDPASRWLTEVRILARMLGRALTTDATPAPAAHRVLRVDADGRWFEPPGGPRVACASRPVMRRMLLALVRGRLASPPRPVTAAELVQAGWPGERILPDAARNRLHVMLTRMRGQGLREILLGSDLGYSFAPDLSIDLVSPLSSEPGRAPM